MARSPGMSMSESHWVIGSAVAIFACALALDLSDHGGMAVQVVYSLAVLPGLGSHRSGAAIVLASFASVLVGAGAVLSPAGVPTSVVVANASIALFATWAAALLVSRHVALRGLHDLAAREGSQLVKELADFKDALDKSSIVAITDQRGVIQYVNDKFCDISRYSREELLGQDHRIVNSGHHPKEFMRDLWRTIAQGDVWRGEIRNRAKDGGYYWVDTTIVPFLDDRGRPFQYVAIRDDITERKRAEAKLHEQAALARLGEMAAVVAHEVKNPLAGISGALEVIASRMPDGSEDKPIVGEMLARLEALNAMVDDMLVFARPKPLRRTGVQLGTLLRETAALLRQDPKLREVEVVVEGGDPQVDADAQVLVRVFQNLVLNAAQAMGGRGRVGVAVTLSDGCCDVAVSDTGPGIPPEFRERIFEPFFTTKHRGTGLGLSVARREVEAHGGTITAGATPGGGATLSVRLPLSGG